MNDVLNINHDEPDTPDEEKFSFGPLCGRSYRSFVFCWA